MPSYAVLGLGMMGEAIVFDLLTFDKEARVYGFELDEERQERILEKFSADHHRFSVHGLRLDLEEPLDGHKLEHFFTEHSINVAFGAIDYKFNEYLTKLCIKTKTHYFDLGGNPDIVQAQKDLDDEAKECGVTIIPDLGLAPGMANILAAHLMQDFDSLDSCHIRVGGLPQPHFKQTILNYQQVFSIRGLTNEYLEDAIVIRDGKLATIPSMTELEELEFHEPYGKLEAFQTAGGTSSLPKLFAGKINELSYKTIRYPGHAQFFQFLKDYELLSSEPYPKNSKVNARELVEYYLQKNLPKGDPDAVLVRITVSGMIAGSMVKKTIELIDEYNPATGFSAMARTTAYPISIVGQMVAKKFIIHRGVVPGELVVPRKEFKEELERRNILFQEVH